MKYTFEIMKEFEDAFKGISVYSVSEDKKLMVDFVAREELEDAQKKIDESYQRGLEDGKAYYDNGCKGCRYESHTSHDEPCCNCINNYTNKYEPLPKDEICFGDEVADVFSKGIVVSRNNTDESIWVLFKGYAVPQKVYKSGYRKTGVHRDIDSYFKES